MSACSLAAKQASRDKQVRAVFFLKDNSGMWRKCLPTSKEISYQCCCSFVRTLQVFSLQNVYEDVRHNNRWKTVGVVGRQKHNSTAMEHLPPDVLKILLQMQFNSYHEITDQYYTYCIWMMCHWNTVKNTILETAKHTYINMLYKVYVSMC